MSDCLPRQGEESLFDPLIYLCRGFHEPNAEFISKLTTLLLCYSPLIRPVRLIANENLVDPFRGMLLNIVVPRSDVCRYDR